MRQLLVLASLAFLTVGACSVSNDLDSLKGSAGQAGQGGADASVDASVCVRNVDCKGCIACEDFCNCAAPLPAVDSCIAGCSDAGNTGGASSGGSGGASSGGASSGGASSGGGGGVATGGASSGGSGGTGAIGAVDCGGEQCSPPSICCYTSTGPGSVTLGCGSVAACPGVTIECEGPSDCGIGQVCCVRFDNNKNVDSVVCANAPAGDCSGADEQVACRESNGVCNGLSACTGTNVPIVKYCDE